MWCIGPREGIKKKNFDRSEGVACSVLYPAGIYGPGGRRKVQMTESL